ncbi:M28 family metallopeptidase [Umezawaea sp. NPDC059074]|uniref:M28 family metallopeptidase n=1 Tax=Umezawaea sp. NPDC059074 TaxID=3346716 RepID=UPI0036AC356D
MTGAVTEDELLALADEIDQARVLSTLEVLCAPEFTGRGIGTPGHDKATAWVAAKFVGLGLEPTSLPFEIPEVYRLESESLLEVEGPRLSATLEHRVDYAEHPRSGPMDAVVEGVATSWDDAPRAGEWTILDHVPQGDAFAELAAKVDEAGGLGLLTPQNPDGSGFLTKRTIGAPPVRLPVVAVRSELLERMAGGTVRAHLPLFRGPATGTDVVAGLPGSDPDSANRPVLISAHYDGVGADPGRHFECAGDNASGVAVLFEIARVLIARGKPFPRPVLFAVVDAEEVGALGSRHHADLLVAAGVRPDVINLDMAGKFNGAVAAEVGGDSTALISALDRAGRALHIPLAGGAVASDNRQYAGRGLPAVGLGLGAAHYHSPLDTLDRIDPDALRMAGRLVVLSTAFLAHDNENIVKE